MALVENQLLGRYRMKLTALPPSGGGGCHPALLGVASLGVMAGVPPEEIFRDLRQQVHGDRRVPDQEIQTAVEKAARELVPHTGGRMPVRGATVGVPRPWTRPPVKPPFQAVAALRRLIEAGRGHGETAVLGQSPVRIDWPPEEDAWRVIEALYAPDEKLYIGPPRGQVRLGHEIREVRQWIGLFRRAGMLHHDRASGGDACQRRPVHDDGVGMEARSRTVRERWRDSVVWRPGAR